MEPQKEKIRSEELGELTKSGLTVLKIQKSEGADEQVVKYRIS